MGRGARGLLLLDWLNAIDVESSWEGTRLYTHVCLIPSLRKCSCARRIIPRNGRVVEVLGAGNRWLTQTELTQYKLREAH